MTPKDAFHHTVHAYPGGAEALAPRMGIKTAQVLRNKANPNSETNVANIDDIMAVQRLTGDYSLLHAMAAELGFVCTKIDQPAACDMAVLESVTDIWSKLGAVGGKVHEALADGRVETHEVKAIEACVYAAMRPMMELLARLNGMSDK